MIKKIIPVLLCLCLSFSVICYGENATDMQETQMPPMGEMPPRGEMPQRGEMPHQGEMPDFGTMPQKGEVPSGAQPVIPEFEMPAEENETTQATKPTIETENIENQPTEEAPSNGRNQGRMPSFGQNQGMQSTEEISFFEEYFDAVVSVILLVLAYVFVIFYKRRQY